MKRTIGKLLIHELKILHQFQSIFDVVALFLTKLVPHNRLDGRPVALPTQQLTQN